MSFSRFSEAFAGPKRSGMGAVPGALRTFHGVRHYDPHQPRVPKGYPDGGEWTRVAADAPSEGRQIDRATDAGSQASDFWNTPLPYWDGMSPVPYGTMTPRTQALGALASVSVPLALLGGAQALGGAVAAVKSVWGLGWAARGFAISDALGANLPRGFPTIDRFADGVITSIKSMDLKAVEYQNAARITSKLNAYIDSVVEFAGARYDAHTISASQIVSRQLHLAIPMMRLTAAQWAAIHAASLRAASSGVTLIVTPFP